ncbi:MAG: hypothetical protein JSV83_07885, partial [Desulfobacterales bacterium]
PAPAIHAVGIAPRAGPKRADAATAGGRSPRSIAVGAAGVPAHSLEATEVAAVVTAASAAYAPHTSVVPVVSNHAVATGTVVGPLHTLAG